MKLMLLIVYFCFSIYHNLGTTVTFEHLKNATSGIEEQTFYKINDLLDYDAEYKLDNKVYFIVNSNYIIFKGVGYTGGDDFNE